MKYKNLKTKIGNIPYCKIKKKEINYRLDCINCKYYEFDKKHVNYSSLNKRVDNLPKKNKKFLKINKNRIKSKGQERFIEVYPELSFIDIFHINYL